MPTFSQLPSGKWRACSYGAPAVPKGSTLEDLIDTYQEIVAKGPGRTKGETLNMLKARVGKVNLASLKLSAVTLRDSIDRRMEDSTQRALEDGSDGVATGNLLNGPQRLNLLAQWDGLLDPKRDPEAVAFAMRKLR